MDVVGKLRGCSGGARMCGLEVIFIGALAFYNLITCMILLRYHTLPFNLLLHFRLSYIYVFLHVN